MVFRKIIIGALLCNSLMYSQSWELINNDIVGETTLDELGFSVSLNSDGNIVAIGAAFGDLNGNDDAGELKVFKNEGGSWTQIGATITGENADERLGGAVSLNSDGSIVAVGAPFSDEAGKINNGKVRILKNEGGTWTQIGNTISGSTAEQFFGSSVSINSDGTVLAIGAPGATDDFINGNTDTSGELKIYKNEAGTWTQIGATITGEAIGDLLGVSVSLNNDGTIVAVGAPRSASNSFSGGKVSVYKNEGGTWNLIGDSFESSAFKGIGLSVDLNGNGDILAIGGFTGEAKIYKNESNTWSLIGSAISAAGSGLLGSSVSLNDAGNRVAIGDPGNGSSGESNKGIIRVFENQSNVWVQVENNIEGTAESDQSGRSVSLNDAGDVLAIGTPGFDNGTTTNVGRVQVLTTNDTVLSVDEVTSVDDLALNFYPNPTSNILQMANTSLKINEVSIYNLQGVLLTKKLINSVSNLYIPIVNLANGTYMVRIKTDKGETTKLFVKE
ncbi:T9SS type A sorting domain-containing protein [Aquimarina agarilytica]|uniref:T9SS type A sorting domain-containing protein n=1 Tax=Aquimarina agarilytica TaxID=1087449 RepID=UPI000289A2EA|nr:T9SS type A sorting domain-containing protein [Aquimarina agarilytica]